MAECTHTRETSKWVTTIDDWYGGETSEWVYNTEYTTVDIGVGAFQCTQCKKVRYYTGSWREFYEEGKPCSGSDYSERTGDSGRVRTALKESK